MLELQRLRVSRDVEVERGKEVCEFMLCAFRVTQFSHDTLVDEMAHNEIGTKKGEKHEKSITLPRHSSSTLFQSESSKCCVILANGKANPLSECAASKANKIIKHSGYIEGLQFDEHTLNIFRFDEVEEKKFVGREAPVRRREDGWRRK
jgi:hypothetical protein